ncbi:MAG: SLBB domain-containing protein, partial [Lutibacter sp.]|jgi:protein involved in polysaccharide export with SLBB domain|nr:SLBB domain-containing protein [Lutibacter sp.]
VQVFARQDLMESQTLTIDGAVNKPQTIPFVAKMRIEDLIALSGGFKEGADATAIDIARRVADGDYEVISQNIQYTSSDQLVSQGSAPFFLEPFDRVSVRYLKGYTIQQNVQIQGEVAYPGTYSIASKKERVSDLLAKAGGFSPYAYVEGAYLLRKLTDQSDKDQLELAAELVAKDSLETEIPVAVNELKIGLNMEKIIKEAGSPSKYDILLEEGDVLYVPTVKQTVQVSGEVLAPALIRYDKSYSFKDYVNRSGGFSQSARKRNAYVIYANGEIRTTKNFLFFRSYPKLAPGALILVPSKAMNKQQKMSLGEIIGLTTSLGTLGVLIKTLSN